MYVSFRHFIRWTEDVASHVVSSAYPRSWNEDHITYGLIAETFSRRDAITYLNSSSHHGVAVRFDAYKARGKVERTYGDIAVLINRRSVEGRTLSGVGFLEAKRRYAGTQEYTALDFSQIERLHSNAPHLQVLLYDYARMTGFPDELIYTDDYNTRPVLPRMSSTQALVVSAGIVRALALKDTSLYSYGLPWSVQLCTRYLAGFDLDFRPDVLASVVSGADTIGGVRYIVVIDADERGDFSEWRADVPRINNDVFERIGAAG